MALPAIFMRRVLMVADICAHTLALLHISLSIYRMADVEPGKSAFGVNLGHKHWLFNLGFIAIIYQISSLLMLLAIAQSASTAAATGSDDSFYTRHRHALCLASRLLRLFYSTAHLLMPGATSYFAHAVAARTRGFQQRPIKALLVNVLQPTAFWMAQVRCCCLQEKLP
jgi:hypothetical protein